MAGSRNIRKLVRHLRNEGTRKTGTEVLDYVRRNVAEQLEGVPGHYRGRLLSLHRRYDVADLTPVWVSPAEITYLTGGYELRDQGHLDYAPYFKPREANWDSVPYEQEVPYGTVLDGDWDQERAAFSNLLMYQGTRQRFVEGMQWTETAFYTRLVERFCEHGWERTDARALAVERCEQIEAVYERLESVGYQSQRELNGHPLHEVTITVSRDGELLYNCEGRHRLCVAKVLGIDSIPVLVLVRHADFDGTVGLKELRENQQ